MSLAERSRRAAATLAEAEYVRIVALATGDGVAAAGLLALALVREGVDFHLSFRRIGDDAVTPDLLTDRVERTVFVGLGAPEIERLKPLGGNAVVLDPVASAEGGIDAIHVGSIEAREGGADACAVASLSYLVARHFANEHADLYPLALAGAIAEGHVSERGARGLDGELLREALAEGHVTEERSLDLEGGSILEALAQSVDPFHPGLTGRARAVKRFLAETRIDPAAESGSLDAEARRTLASRLVLRYLATPSGASAADAFLTPRYLVPGGGFLGTRDANYLARRMTEAAALGRAGGVVSALLGNAAQPPAPPEAETLSARLLPILLKAEGDAAKGGLVTLDTGEPGLSCAAALVASRYLAPERAVVAAHAHRGEDVIVDMRGRAPPQPLVQAATRAAAETGGVAWGMRRFARARIPRENADVFLATLNRTLAGETS